MAIYDWLGEGDRGGGILVLSIRSCMCGRGMIKISFISIDVLFRSKFLKAFPLGKVRHYSEHVPDGSAGQSPLSRLHQRLLNTCRHHYRWWSLSSTRSKSPFHIFNFADAPQ